MLTDNFKILIFSDSELKNTYDFLYRSEADKKFWSKIWCAEDFYSYAIKQEFHVHEIKSFVIKLFDILHEEALCGNMIWLVVYDGYEIVNAISEDYKIIEVTGCSQYYDFVYRIEQSDFLPLMVYKF